MVAITENSPYLDRAQTNVLWSWRHVGPHGASSTVCVSWEPCVQMSIVLQRAHHGAMKESQCMYTIEWRLAHPQKTPHVFSKASPMSPGVLALPILARESPPCQVWTWRQGHAQQRERERERERETLQEEAVESDTMPNVARRQRPGGSSLCCMCEDISGGRAPPGWAVFLVPLRGEAVRRRSRRWRI